MEQKLKGIRFVNKLNKGYGTLVGAAMAYMILADYKQNNSPKTIDEFNKWVEDSVNDEEGIKDEKCMEINWA